MEGTCPLRSGGVGKWGARGSIAAKANTGREAVRSYGSATIEAGQSHLVQVPITELPVQSVGAAAPVQMLVEYELETPTIEGPPNQVHPARKHELTARTIARYVTFEPGFAAATVRSITAQGVENRRISTGAATTPAAPSALRVFDGEQGRMHEVSQGPQRQGQGVSSFVRLRPEELPAPMREMMASQRGER